MPCEQGEGYPRRAELPPRPGLRDHPLRFCWPIYRLKIGPPLCYLICANAGCGSTLLSRALSDNGIAGHPDEYFVTGPPETFSPGSTFWEDGPLARSSPEHASRRSSRPCFLGYVFQCHVVVGIRDLIAKGEKAWLRPMQARCRTSRSRLSLEVIYEDFSIIDGYELTVRRFLRHLDLDNTETPRPRTDRQADGIR